MRLFVYGTLKSRYKNNALLVKLKVRYCGKSTTRGRFCLGFHLYPYLTERCPPYLKGRVVIECYSIRRDKIAAIDRYEDMRIYRQETVKDSSNKKGVVYMMRKRNPTKPIKFKKPIRGKLCF
ncbi:gamma-glutamylcyclotransferase family protein [Hippea sp. KM1]|uniref:gamma-glutamylcyclotransferase family protein n=1 Tax=Hippea sp. KM1 TaxID=944481 RepID=UPI00046C9063|nr:gamma-glutamylcyclotransferase family protein [Hippea sp. KM1]